MSAWVVSRKHIAYMVLASTIPDFLGSRLEWFHGGNKKEIGPAERWNRDRIEAVGNMLWKQCVKSVKYRYGGPASKLPGHKSGKFKFEDVPLTYPEPFDWIQLIQSVHCYEYQSCEDPDWKPSEAHEFCKCLIEFALVHLTHNKACVWGPPAWLAPEDYEGRPDAHPKKKFVVIGTYKDNQQRYAQDIEADTAEHAEKDICDLVKEESGEDLLVAAVVEGDCNVVL